MTPRTQTLLTGNDDGLPGDCLRAAVATLLDLPVEGVPHFLLFGDGWTNAWIQWHAHRFETLEMTLDQPDGPSIAMGMSPRGIYHAVVWDEGRCIHDPHPSRAGLSRSPDKYWRVVSA